VEKMNNLTSSTPENILIVDDTPANLRLLSQMLAEKGYGVRAVKSGLRALESVKVTQPSLILLDIRMPEMNGYEVCQHLKEDPKTKDIPIIFISALNDIENKVKGFQIGGVDYITKPFQIEEVLARVETHLALRKLQKQLQDANKKFEEELALAGSLQASFFPSEPPQLPGWQLAVTLKAARETSGDFYDVYRLPNGHLAMLVADVVDKGAAAALYMALSWTLIRTYAREYPDQPELVLGSANSRIISDTDASRFVSVFYGVLDPNSGKLVYCNAGHNPPLRFNPESREHFKILSKTGLILGILKNETWKQGTIELLPGDILVHYTDGVTEAQNMDGELYGVKRLIRCVQENLHRSAQEIRSAILEDISAFIGFAPQFDDIALVILVRESTEEVAQTP
jgi:sigma-B regulation protein RsbU (phosphoserine phosphatase)